MEPIKRMSVSYTHLDVYKRQGMDILGAAFREVPQELKRQLNLGYGVEVKGVTDGKMKAAGIRKGFIILKANGQPVNSVNDLEDVLKAATQSPDQVLFLSGMFPSGKRANYAVDLTPVSYTHLDVYKRQQWQVLYPIKIESLL